MTPSGAPPIPYSISTPPSGKQHNTEPATSPSGTQITRTPSWCIWLIIASWRGLASTMTVSWESSLPIREATRRKFCSSGKFRSIMPLASGPTINFSIYMSGARRKVFLPPAASTEIALSWPSAVKRVPSIGSTAIETNSPIPEPTFSPIYNIGASSISPSPITISPSILMRLSI